MRFSNKPVEEKVVNTVKVAVKKATKAADKKAVKATVKKPTKAADKKAVKATVKKPTKVADKKAVIKKSVESKTEKVKPVKVPKAKALPLKVPEVNIVQFICEPNDLPTHIQEKVIRRAKRYFAGQSIKHRVVDKTENSISFKFNRHGKKYAELPHCAVVTVKKVA